MNGNQEIYFPAVVIHLCVLFYSYFSFLINISKHYSIWYCMKRHEILLYMPLF